MRIATPAYFCFPFAWNIFFHHLTFSLYVSWGLKWMSCRQHMYGSCFCIHSASLCLLVGTFNLFTFKVIIYIYVPIAILLIVWGWLCRSFPSLLFLDYISPSNIVVNLVWWHWILLTFVCLKAFYFFTIFWWDPLWVQ